MKITKGKYFDTDGNTDLIVFKDSKSDDYYCMTREESDNKEVAHLQLNRHKTPIPDNLVVKARPFIFESVRDEKMDNYKPAEVDPFDFPINKIEWVWMRGTN